MYPLADILCTKDTGSTGEVFKNTVKTSLEKGVNRVHHGKVKFEMDSGQNDGKSTLLIAIMMTLIPTLTTLPILKHLWLAILNSSP